MKIVLSGVETNNKGAELMLYAILQEIERRYPKSTVYINSDKIKQGSSYVKTSLPIVVLKPRWIYSFVKRLHLLNLLNRLHFKVLPHTSAYVKGADFFLDGSGLHFCDQFIHDSKRVLFWENTLRKQKKDGTRIVFLPQGFGPLDKEGTKASICAVSKYAHLIYAREQKSYDYLQLSGIVDMEKVKVCTDFTCLVKGIFPQQYEKLKNAVCIIPNKRMISRGNLTKEEYLSYISTIVTYVKNKGFCVYLLNHEGRGDEQLINECKQYLSNDVETVTGLNALETKGLIATAYIVISSRFHGVASALNSCIPCLATSWSHKYAYLYKDYELNELLMSIKNIGEDLKILERCLDENVNKSIREHLNKIQPQIVQKVNEMWEDVWKI